MPSYSLQLANFFSIMKLSMGRWKGPDTYPLTQGILHIFCQLLNQLFIFINAQTHSEKSWHSYLRHSNRQSPLFLFCILSDFILIFSFINIYKETKLPVWGVGWVTGLQAVEEGGGEDGATLFCDNTESKNNRDKWTAGNENKKCCLCVPTHKELHSK